MTTVNAPPNPTKVPVWTSKMQWVYLKKITSQLGALICIDAMLQRGVITKKTPTHDVKVL